MIENHVDDLGEYLESVMRATKPHRHAYYDKTVQHYKDMAVHVDGAEPYKLLKDKRPNEPDDVRDYRMKIWQPVTKSKSKKVISVINRIFNQKFYRIELPEMESNVLRKEDQIADYLLESYPNYRSLINYIKDVFLKKCLEDPNGVCLVIPENFDTDGDLVSPVPVIIKSKRLLDFLPGKYYTVDVTDYSKQTGAKRIKKVMIVDDKAIRYFDKEGEVDEPIMHNIGVPPMFRLGGVVTEDEYPYCYESYISGVLPHWNNAVMTRSDYDGQLVLHAYLERWEYESVDCRECHGTGSVEYYDDNFKEKKLSRQCDSCGGTGKRARVSKGPYEVFVINRNALDPGGDLPIPPAGYIEKDISVIDKLKEEYEAEIEAGLSAINMDIVSKVGEDQSGIAKTIDRQDLDSFLQQVSDHLFKYVIPNITDLTIAWRYRTNGVYTREYEYSVQQPTRFDVYGIAYMMEEFKMAKESEIDSSVVTQMQLDLIDKMFSGQAKEKAKVMILHDPLPGKGDEELMVMLANGVIDRKDWKFKTYLPNLVQKAIIKEEGFLMMDYQKQREILMGLLEEIEVPEPIVPNES